METSLVERSALIALLRLPGVSWREVATELLVGAAPRELLEQRLGASDGLFPLGDADRLIDEASKSLGAWSADGIGVHAVYEDGYPPRLRDIREMPPIIFTRGTRTADDRAIAVVGTRRASEQGIKTTRNLATALARKNITVVSGLAAGIDSAAHRAALDEGGRTVAVIGTGINRAYPSTNVELQQEITEKGLVLSQFWPETGPKKQHFPMRNAIMSGYSAATVVVEAPEISGARIQARLALEHGRSVIFPRALLANEWAKAYADRPGVHIVEDYGELIDTVERVFAGLTADPTDPEWIREPIII